MSRIGKRAGDRLRRRHLRRHHAGRRRHRSPRSSPTTRPGVGRATRRNSATAREEGIAAPETANNTVASTALIPLSHFGIPGSNSAAVLLGGLLIHGLLPGPRLFEQNAEVIHGLYLGSFVATLAQLLRRRADPASLHLAGEPAAALSRRLHLRADPVGHLHAQHHSLFDLGIALGAGLIGYLMRHRSASRSCR